MRKKKKKKKEVRDAYKFKEIETIYHRTRFIFLENIKIGNQRHE